MHPHQQQLMMPSMPLPPLPMPQAAMASTSSINDDLATTTTSSTSSMLFAAVLAAAAGGGSGNHSSTGASTSISAIDARIRLQWQWLILTLMPITCVIGNILVIAAVWTTRSLQSPTNYLLVSLAVADLIVGTLVMPFNVYLSINELHWHLPIEMCYFYCVIDVAASTSSIVHLVLISIDRLVAATRPADYKTPKHRRRVYIAIGLGWAFSIALPLPLITSLNTQTTHFLVHDHYCGIFSPLYMLCSSIFAFYLPCIVMLLTYGYIFRTLRRRLRAIQLQELAGGHLFGFGADVGNITTCGVDPRKRKMISWEKPLLKKIEETAVEHASSLNDSDREQLQTILDAAANASSLTTPSPPHPTREETTTTGAAAAEKSDEVCHAKQQQHSRMRRLKQVEFSLRRGDSGHSLKAGKKAACQQCANASNPRSPFIVRTLPPTASIVEHDANTSNIANSSTKPHPSWRAAEHSKLEEEGQSVVLPSTTVAYRPPTQLRRLHRRFSETHFGRKLSAILAAEKNRKQAEEYCTKNHPPDANHMEAHVVHKLSLTPTATSSMEFESRPMSPLSSYGSSYDPKKNVDRLLLGVAVVRTSEMFMKKHQSLRRHSYQPGTNFLGFNSLSSTTKKMRRLSEVLTNADWDLPESPHGRPSLSQMYQMARRESLYIARKKLAGLKDWALDLLARLRNRQGIQIRRETRATKLVATVLVVFLICWLPFFSFNLVKVVLLWRDSWSSEHEWLFHWFTGLGYLNSSLNFFIYSAINKARKYGFQLNFGKGVAGGKTAPSSARRASKEQQHAATGATAGGGGVAANGRSLAATGATAAAAKIVDCNANEVATAHHALATGTTPPDENAFSRVADGLWLAADGELQQQQQGAEPAPPPPPVSVSGWQKLRSMFIGKSSSSLPKANKSSLTGGGKRPAIFVDEATASDCAGGGQHVGVSRHQQQQGRGARARNKQLLLAGDEPSISTGGQTTYRLTSDEATAVLQFASSEALMALGGVEFAARRGSELSDNNNSSAASSVSIRAEHDMHNDQALQELEIFV